MVVWSPRTGTVWLRDFDLGIVTGTGALLDPAGSPGGNNYYIDLSSGPCNSPDSDGFIPVIFNNPEPIYEQKIYPSVLIKRDDFVPALQRWHQYQQYDYYMGIPGTEETVGGVSGFTQAETKPSAWPYDITYSVSIYSRYEYEAQMILQSLMRRFQPRSYITVVDTEGDNRRYTAFVDNSVSDIGEFVDASERLRGYSLSIKVEGEIDLVDPVVKSTMKEFVQSTGTL
jgi:hypothetical protein